MNGARVGERKVAIVLMNLGGPDGPEDVRPFLYNLFSDGAIIAAPQPFRTLIATLISTTRAKSARANYALMGGGSPLLRETQTQADALTAALASRGLGVEAKCFIAMRYWKPFVHDAARAAADWGATEAVILPLYPQFSTTTTGSSLKAWTRASTLPTSTICCYPSAGSFIQAHADAILHAWRKGGEPAAPRVLFSAHGLPQIVVDRGDPYQWQVERTVAEIAKRLPPEWAHRVCYQSRVGPMKWLGPSTVEAIDEAARDKAGVIVAPVAFVSEHIETLVELDIEYAEHARGAGIPYYLRAPALGAAAGYIETLAEQAARAIANPKPLRSEAEERICPAAFGLCPQAKAT